jgi:predicted dehydrogenase
MTENKRPLRGAVIGYGFISGKGHIPAYLERGRRIGDVEIVAVADICEARRQAAAKNVPGARIYASHEALLANERGNLDFIDIATPPCDHAEIARAGFNAGLHVICEKPMATTVEDARAMLFHARRSERVLFPCHNYKHAPVVKTIRGIIESGQIGKVRSVTLQTFRNTHAKGVEEWRTDWRREKRFSGGGIAMDHGSHSFYLCFDWLGSYPTAVTAKMNTLESQWDTEDNFSTVLTFPNGLAHAHLTWTAGVRKVIYSVQGDRGAITVDDDDVQVARMVSEKNGSVTPKISWKVEKSVVASHWMDASHVTWFESLFEEFQRAIEKREYVGREAREAVRCVEVITSAYRSSNEGCREIALLGDAPASEHIDGVRAGGNGVMSIDETSSALGR